MKKLLSVLLAAVMLLAMAGVAMADLTGDLTVIGLENGEQVTIYQIIGYDEVGGQAAGTTWMGSLADWAKSMNGDAELAPGKVPSGMSEAEFYNQMIAQVHGGNAGVLTKSENATSGSASFAGIPAGSYLVEISGGVNIHRANVVSLTVGENNTDVASATLDVAKENKMSKPTIEKDIDRDNFTFDETVTFTITANVPKYPEGATNTIFKIGDRMDECLTLVAGTVKVYKNSKSDANLLTENTDYTITYPGTSGSFLTGTGIEGDNRNKKEIFEIDFSNSYARVKEYETIVVEYQAKVTDTTILGVDTNNNQAILTYTNAPFGENGYKEEQDIENLYTYGIQVTKQNENNELLEGAEFTLTYNNQRLTFKSVNGVYEPTGYTDKDYDRENADNNTDIVLKTNAQGKIEIKGLRAGTYTLTEKLAPIMDANTGKRYRILKPETTIVIEQATDHKYVKDQEGNDTRLVNASATVTNYTSILPITGGMGTTIFMVAGIAVMACAVVALMVVLKRQKHSEG